MCNITGLQGALLVPKSRKRAVIAFSHFEKWTHRIINNSLHSLLTVAYHIWFYYNYTLSNDLRIICSFRSQAASQTILFVAFTRLLVKSLST